MPTINCYPNQGGSGNTAYFCAGCDGPGSNTACYSADDYCGCQGGAAYVGGGGPIGPIQPNQAIPLKENRVPPRPIRKYQTRLLRRRGSNFNGMNPVQQRPIGVNPSQGGFFSMPSGERNFGQQSSLPYDQQLNFAHSNASGCGYSNMNHMNMNHSNFGANTASTTWSGAQTNVGPQDRIFAGNYANGHRRR